MYVDGQKVVKELDVYVCNGALGSGFELYDLEFPIRPPWRGYRTLEVDKLKIKPRAKRIEFTVPVDGFPHNQDDKHKQMPARGKEMSLRSQYSKPEGLYAVGVLQGDSQLFLMPLDHCVQMRPAFTYLEKDDPGAAGARGRGRGGGAAAAAAAARDDEDEPGPSRVEEKKPDLMAVQVQVKKRETERQIEMRLSSYAHLKQMEDEEQWRELQFVHGRDHFIRTLGQVAQSDSVPEQPKLPIEAYSNQLAPVIVSQFQGLGPSGGRGGPVQDLLAPPPPPGPAAHGGAAAGAASTLAPSSGPIQLTTADKKSLQDFVLGFLDGVRVANLANIKEALASAKNDKLRPLERLPDKALHETLTAHGNILCIRRSYLLKSLGNPALDPFRDLVIELLKDKEQLRKNDVKDLASQKNLEVNDGLYGKVMKELCSSRGALWTLKSGAG